MTKIFKLNLFIYFKKNLIVTNEKKKEMIIEIKFNWVKASFSDNSRFFKPKIETAPKIGIESKNDIFAESNLLNFNNLAAVMAMPDLLTPGTKDNIWNNPIKMADL